MIRTLARRCTPYRGRATWCDISAQRCTISTSRASNIQQHPRRQHSRQSYPEQGQTETEDVFDEDPEGQENDLPEPEIDWLLSEQRFLPIAEQEARFERSVAGRYITKVLQPCRACEGTHSLAFCPFVFDDIGVPSHKTNRQKRTFSRQMDNSQDFRDAVVYIRERFKHRMPKGNPIVVPPSETQDAPPLARGKGTRLPHQSVYKINLDLTFTTLMVTEWLRNFNSVVHFKNHVGDDFDPWNYVRPRYSYFTGHYPTTDDDGRPFVIVWTNTAHLDERMPYGKCSTYHLHPILRLATSTPP